MQHENTAIGWPAGGAIISIALALAVMLSLGAEARTETKNTKKDANLPYTTIDHPQFVSASQARFLGPKDIVLGVTEGKAAKAYPAAILAQHGVVQDRMADGPIAITW